ncbi:unnamed protein product, partial [Dicrocoelium dendriticum]
MNEQKELASELANTPPSLFHPTGCPKLLANFANVDPVVCSDCFKFVEPGLNVHVRELRFRGQLHPDWSRHQCSENDAEGTEHVLPS